MFKNKVFKFKDQNAADKFAFAWEGQTDQQLCLTDFIGNSEFMVVSCTPLGSVRTIQRLPDMCYYYTELPEPLIDASEIKLFFEEVIK